MSKVNVHGLKELLVKYNRTLEESFLTCESSNISDYQGRYLYREFYNRSRVSLSSSPWHIEEHDYCGDNDYNRNLSLNFGFVLYYDGRYILDYYKDVEKNNTLIYSVLSFDPGLPLSEQERLKCCIEDVMGDLRLSQ